MNEMVFSVLFLHLILRDFPASLICDVYLHLILKLLMTGIHWMPLHFDSLGHSQKEKQEKKKTEGEFWLLQLFVWLACKNLGKGE